MSGRATFHTRIATALNHIVASKQFSSQDSAGYVPMKYRETPQNSVPLPHRIVGLSASTSSTSQEDEKRKAADALCLILFSLLV